MNQQKINYSKELEKMITDLEKKGSRPSLLLQVCCAPCSSYCLEYLREYFDITVLFYNPNISEEAEYEKRKAEEKRLIEAYNRQVQSGDFAGMNSTPKASVIKIVECDYESEVYENAIRGLESYPEGGDRCSVCFRVRLEKTAEMAKEHNFDFFTTTLTISPLKNAEKLNTIGQQAGERYGVSFLPSDFKKKNGYKRSIELSAMFDLYRQNYCGCKYSRRD